MWLIIFAVIVVVIAIAVNSNSSLDMISDNDNSANTNNMPVNLSNNTSINTPIDTSIDASTEALVNLIVEELSSKLVKKLWDICQHPYADIDDWNIVTICYFMVCQYGVVACLNSSYDNTNIEFDYPFAIHEVPEIHNFRLACDVATKINEGISYKIAMLWEFYDGVFREDEKHWNDGKPYECTTYKVYAIKNLTKEAARKNDSELANVKAELK